LDSNEGFEKEFRQVTVALASQLHNQATHNDTSHPVDDMSTISVGRVRFPFSVVPLGVDFEQRDNVIVGSNTIYDLGLRSSSATHLG
jgi:hypothetical protein